MFDNIISKADALKAVASGDKSMDIVTQLTPQDAKAFDGHGHAHIQSDDAKTVLAGVFNQTGANSPWKNIKLRQAMNMAVDRAALLKDAGGGYGVLMPATTPPRRRQRSRRTASRARRSRSARRRSTLPSSSRSAISSSRSASRSRWWTPRTRRRT